MGRLIAGCSRPSSEAAASEDRKRTLGYVESKRCENEAGGFFDRSTIQLDAQP